MSRSRAVSGLLALALVAGCSDDTDEPRATASTTTTAKIGRAHV